MKREFIFVVVLALWALALPGCSRSSPPAWKVTTTGLHGIDVYWCDSTHIAAQDTEGPIAAPRLAVRLLDLSRPNDTSRVGLPGMAGPQGELRILDCDSEKGMIVRARSVAAPGHQDTWALPLTGNPVLIATTKPMGSSGLKEKLVNLPANLIVSSMPRQISGESYTVDEQCAGFVNAGLKLLCFDPAFQRLIALRRLVIADYLWEDEIGVQRPNGEPVVVRNNRTRLFDKSGKPVVRASFLYDLDKRVIARLDQDSLFQVEGGTGFAIDPEDTWLYSPCKLKSKSRPERIDFDRVCRYRLDGTAHSWEQVFFFEAAGRSRFAIQSLSVDRGLNVFFDMPGTTGKTGGIWRFNATSKEIERIVTTGQDEYFSNPVAAPDGRAVLFKHNNTWKLAEK